MTANGRRSKEKERAWVVALLGQRPRVRRLESALRVVTLDRQWICSDAIDRAEGLALAILGNERNGHSCKQYSWILCLDLEYFHKKDIYRGIAKVFLNSPE
jgi:hypothetical protein